MTDAFDADVLIYAARGDQRGAKALGALSSSEHAIGSTLLLPETLIKPSRVDHFTELGALQSLLAEIELRPVDEEVAMAAVLLGAKYRLHAPDAIHLATAVVWGADRFHTNNRNDFDCEIVELEVVFADAR